MNQLYKDMFRAMGQFGKLKISEMFPKISQMDYFTMAVLMDKEQEKKMTISELACKTRSLPPAVSRTLKGLEEKGYVERNVNKKDRRNTYVELTEAGRNVVKQCQKTMDEFGKSVMSQVDEEEMVQLISFLNQVYEIAEQEIENRKEQNRKEKGHE